MHIPNGGKGICLVPSQTEIQHHNIKTYMIEKDIIHLKWLNLH